MKRLVGLPLETQQEDELLRLLVQAQISHQITRTHTASYIGGDAIWVADNDYTRARELLEREAQAFAETARANWNAEWRAEYKGSYRLWLWNRVRRATLSTVFRVVLLIAVVSLMLLYPLAYVLR